MRFSNESCASTVNSTGIVLLPFAARRRTNQLTYPCQLPSLTRSQASQTLHKRTDKQTNVEIAIGPAGPALPNVEEACKELSPLASPSQLNCDDDELYVEEVEQALKKPKCGKLKLHGGIDGMQPGHSKYGGPNQADFLCFCPLRTCSRKSVYENHQAHLQREGQRPP